MAEKILIVDDEPAIAGGLAFNLRQEGYETRIALTGQGALDTLQREPQDLILLDLMLPDGDGIDLCRAIRAVSDIPILMVTARDREAEKVRGLEAGADDYITKPFGIMEVVARVKGALRRARGHLPASSRIAVGPITIDRDTRSVTVSGRAVELRRREFDLLWVLASVPGRVYTRDDLLATVWEDREFVEPGTLDVHVRRLREKLEEDPAHPRHILTLRGVGYKIEP